MIKTIIRTVSEMCPKKQFYHHKNIWTVPIVKFEFLGYNANKKHVINIDEQGKAVNYIGAVSAD